MRAAVMSWLWEWSASRHVICVLSLSLFCCPTQRNEPYGQEPCDLSAETINHILLKEPSNHESDKGAYNVTSIL